MSLSVPLTTLLALLLGSVRAAAWLAICPPFNGRGLPVRAKALLSIGLALPFTDHLATTMPRTITSAGLLTDVAEQVVVGAALGFCTYLFVIALQSAGSLLDLFGGFALAFSFDPFSYTGNAILGRVYNLTATTLLLATDAHQLILAGFARSYRALPPTGTLSLERLSRLLSDGIGEMFLAALQISGPLIAVLFLTDLAFGLLSRVAPSLNAFGLGFPAKILLTLVLAGTAMRFLPETVARLTEQAVGAVLELLGG
ncbi:MAG: flagellar biosynthetic protein FliR [Dactylosporangium sp.]|nr:flagellar biosynthetic protein FliR [Dactylosporangium sp.]NNJ61280.1 flagellar biosynthetic protein FliR [Dactylosporangium sp.]